ncbi:Lbh [Columba livia]|nr:Lbh [Columba livia]
MLSFVSSSDYLRSAEMTEVMMNTPAMDEIGLSPRKDGLSYQEPVDYNITRYRTRLGKDLVVSELMKTPLIQHSQRLKWEVERIRVCISMALPAHLDPGAAAVHEHVHPRGKLWIFPDPSDFDRYCKLKDRLPSIVVEPTEGDVESGELRWPPEEFLVQEEEEEEEENCEDAKKDNKEQ